MPRKPLKVDLRIAPPDAAPATTSEPEHSPLGASSAERWFSCPGSTALIRALGIPEDTDEPDYRAEGIAMHEAAAKVLTERLETWEIVGEVFHDVTVTAKMGEAIAVYVNHVLPLIAESYQGAQGPKIGDDYWVEARLRSNLHPLAYGTVDFGSRLLDLAPQKSWLRIRDLKGGEGLVVEVYENPQMMYYACLLIEQHPEWDDAMNVELGIVQPRAFHPDGPIRLWETTVGELREWQKDVLVPAMVRTEIDKTLLPGDWCRFCPARLVCPALQGLFRALCNVDQTHVVNWSNESLDRTYALLPMAQHARKAIEEEVFKRANKGVRFESGKLVAKKANRVWPDGIMDKALTALGADVLTTPALKSPPQIEALGPKGKAFVKEFAYTPNTGFTIAPRSDPRREQEPDPEPDLAEKFQPCLSGFHP